MNRIALAVLGMCLALGPLAGAEEWSKTYTITGKPDLRVETSDANIHVDTWDQNSIEARVTTDHYKIGEGGVKIDEHQTGDSVTLEVHLRMHVSGFISINRGGRVQIEIHMPREGRVNLHTSDGSIHLSNFKGEMELESSDGHQEIDGVDGSLRAHASDGHIRAAGRFDALALSTADGHIDARVLPGSTLTSIWDLHTGDGSIVLQLPENFAADVDLHTGDGHIDLDMPVTVEWQLGRKNIHGKLNGGGNLLTIHTGDGSIRLQKS
jgi:DUF4097 and DUF4098 domain-containing protein YvlB